jgi:hypothetical protein
MKYYDIDEGPYPESHMTYCFAGELWYGWFQVGSEVYVIHRFQNGKWGFELVENEIVSTWLLVGTLAEVNAEVLKAARGRVISRFDIIPQMLDLMPRLAALLVAREL